MSGQETRLSCWRRRALAVTGSAAAMVLVVACQSGAGHVGASTPSPSTRATPSISPESTESTLTSPLAALSPPIREIGIEPAQAGPFSASDFDCTTFWEAPIGQTWYLVYAGGIPENPASPEDGVESAVALFTQGSNLNDAPAFQGFYEAPSAMGKLTITAATGESLTLQDEGGHFLTFNVVTHTYPLG